MDPAWQPRFSTSQVDLTEDRGGEVVAASIILLILPTIAVILRLCSRLLSRAGFWWDDYTVIVAMVLSWGPNISNIDSVNRGLGKHFLAIAHPPDGIGTLREFFRVTFAFAILYIFAMTATKFSIIFFMYRIFPIVHFKRFLLVSATIVGCWGFSSLMVNIFSCRHIPDFWNTLAGQVGGRCVDITKSYIAMGSLNSALNFILLGLPIPLLWKLKTSVLQKCILTIIFFLGLTVCAVGLTYIIVLSNFKPENDLSWNYVDTVIWAAAEPSIAVVCACLPSFRPLLARLIWGRAYHPSHLPRSSQQSLSKSWLSGSRDMESQPSRRFNRLRESEGHLYGMNKPWRHNVAISAREMGENSDVYNMEGGQQGWPREGIQVRTTITISEGVDWRDDLF